MIGRGLGLLRGTSKGLRLTSLHLTGLRLSGLRLTGLRLRGCLEPACKRATQPQRVRSCSCSHHGGAGRGAPEHRASTALQVSSFASPFV